MATALVGAAAAASSEQATAVLDRAAHRKARILGVITALIGLFAVGVFSRVDGDATYILSRRGDDLLDFAVPAGTTALLLGLFAFGLGVYGAVRAAPSRATLLLALAMVLFVAAMLTWATADGSTSLVGLFNGTLRRASPLVFGALAGVLCERVGIVNIGIEGMLLGGAFAGAFIGSAASNSIVGVLGGVAIGALFASLLAVLSIRYKVDQVVGGTAINIFSLGITSYLGARVLTEYPDLNNTDPFRPISVPLLREIPLIGPVVFDNTPHVYAAFFFVAAVTFAIYRTRWGLRMRACGEHPSAADTVGINVNRMRFWATVLGGAVAGFGGTYFTLDSSRNFQENMTAGRGFIALAALIFGRWHPVGALGAALVFGFAEEFQGRLASLGSPIPSEFLLMTPYIVTLIVVAGLLGRARPPAAEGKPFER
jgi:simple sugar transport system permease protein